MRSNRSALTNLLMAFLLGVCLVLGVGPAARAHSDLVSSTPKNGATLATMPDSVTLVFNEEIDPNFAQAVVSDAKDVARPQTPGVTGATLTVPIPEEVPDGTVEVRYRIVSKDGHPVAGTVAFTAGTPAATGSTGSTAGAPAPQATAPDTATTPASSATASVEGREEAANTWMYALTGMAVLLVAAVGAAIYFMTRRRRH